jgi:hypothetical protein
MDKYFGVEALTWAMGVWGLDKSNPGPESRMSTKPNSVDQLHTPRNRPIATAPQFALNSLHNSPQPTHR